VSASIITPTENLIKVKCGSTRGQNECPNAVRGGPHPHGLCLYDEGMCGYQKPLKTPYKMDE